MFIKYGISKSPFLNWASSVSFRALLIMYNRPNFCPIPVKTDVEQVDLVLRLSDGTSEKIRDSQTCRYDGQIYFHWYKILGLLYKRALFDLQFVQNLFWLKLKWNARSKLFYCIIYRSSMLWWSSRTLTKLKSQSQKPFNTETFQMSKAFSWSGWKDPLFFFYFSVNLNKIVCFIYITGTCFW